MGAWGNGPFDNDDALDLLALIENDVIEGLNYRLTIAADADPDVDIDAMASAMAIAAAALVASRVSGTSAGDLVADEWLQAFPFPVNPQLVALAVRGVERVAQGSELEELWDEMFEVGEWRSSLDDILVALRTGGVVGPPTDVR